MREYDGVLGLRAGAADGLGVYGLGGLSAGVGVCGCGQCGLSGRGSFYGVVGTGGSYDFWSTNITGHYGCASSKRWKTNIQNISCALEKLVGINGVYFDWIPEKGGQHSMGFIAENVGAYVPESVVFENSDDIKNLYIENGETKTYAIGVDSASLVPVLVEAIKELKLEIDILKNK